jgi:hypothetical protein
VGQERIAVIGRHLAVHRMCAYVPGACLSGPVLERFIAIYLNALHVRDHLVVVCQIRYAVKTYVRGGVDVLDHDTSPRLALPLVNQDLQEYSDSIDQVTHKTTTRVVNAVLSESGHVGTSGRPAVHRLTGSPAFSLASWSALIV